MWRGRGPGSSDIGARERGPSRSRRFIFLSGKAQTLFFLIVRPRPVNRGPQPRSRPSSLEVPRAPPAAALSVRPRDSRSGWTGIPGEAALPPAPEPGSATALLPAPPSPGPPASGISRVGRSAVPQTRPRPCPRLWAHVPLSPSPVSPGSGSLRVSTHPDAGPASLAPPLTPPWAARGRKT